MRWCFPTHTYTIFTLFYLYGYVVTDFLILFHSDPLQTSHVTKFRKNERLKQQQDSISEIRFYPLSSRVFLFFIIIKSRDPTYFHHLVFLHPSFLFSESSVTFSADIGRREPLSFIIPRIELEVPSSLLSISWHLACCKTGDTLISVRMFSLPRGGCCWRCNVVSLVF